MKITDIFVLGAIILFLWFVLSSISQIMTGKRGKGGNFGEPAKEACVGFDDEGKMIIKNCDEVFKD